MKEIYKNIKNYENYYQCSNLGNVKSLDRIILKENKPYQKIKGRVLKQTKLKNGYLTVSLRYNGNRKTKYVHRIIAETFIQNPNNYKTVNHIDGNKLNNNISNLEWASQSKNNKHSYESLNKKINRKGGKKIKVKITNIMTNKNIIYNSIAQTSSEIGLSETQIRRYLNNNKLWKGIYKFKKI